MIRKRAFPQKPGDRFDICDPCSLKFFVLQLYNEYSVRAAAKDKTLKYFQKDYNEKKEAYLKIRKQHNDRKRVVCID